MQLTQLPRRCDACAAEELNMTSDEKYLTVQEASQFCRARGLPVAVGTLNRLRVQGGSARFVKFGGRRIAYSERALLEWLGGRLSGEVASTSEYRAA
jgi:hypothetical protein